MDLATLLKAVNDNSAQSQEIASGIRSSYGAAIGATSQAANAIERGAEAAVIVESQKNKGLLEAQTQMRRAATANGTNLSSENEILTSLFSQQRQQAEEVSKRAAKVDAIAQQANLGNPLGLIYDIFYGDGERRALESGKAQLDVTTQSIQALNQATQTTAQTQKTIAETMSDVSVAAADEVILAQAAQAVADKKVKMATLNVDMLQNINALNNQQLSNAFRIWQAEESAEHRAFLRAQKEEALAAKKADEESMQEVIDYHNQGAKLLGIAPIANRRQLETFRKMGKDVQARMDLAIQKGFELAQTGKLSFGNTPIEALGLQQTFKIDIPPIQQPVFNKMSEWVQELEANPGQTLVALGLESSPLQADAAYQKAKPEEKQQILNAAINAKFREEAKNLKLGDPTNLLALPPIDSLKGSPILESNPFLAKYVKPSVDAGGGIAFEPGKYIAMAEGDLASGELTTSDIAEGLTQMSKSLFTKGVLAKGLTSAFGLPPIEDYPVVVDTKSDAPLFGGTGRFGLPGTSNSYAERIDILDTAEWNKYLSNYLRRKVSSGVLGRFSVTGGN